MENNKNKIVKLHNKEDNSVILVNFDDVLLVDTVWADNRIFSMVYTQLLRDDTIHYFEVNETPEKIFATNPDIKGFIKLHNKETNLVFFVDTEMIHIVDTVRTENENDSSVIYMYENIIEPIKANETPERIYTMIEECYKTVSNNGQ